MTEEVLLLCYSNMKHTSFTGIKKWKFSL